MKIRRCYNFEFMQSTLPANILERNYIGAFCLKSQHSHEISNAIQSTYYIDMELMSLDVYFDVK